MMPAGRRGPPEPMAALAGFRAAIRNVTFGSPALQSRASQLGSAPLPTDAQSKVALYRDAAVLARDILQDVATTAASTPKRSAPKAPQALRRAEQVVRRLRDDWPDALTTQREDLAEVLPEAVKQIDVKGTEDSKSGHVKYELDELGLGHFEELLERMAEEWRSEVEVALREELEEALEDPRATLEQEGISLELPDVRVALASLRSLAVLDYEAAARGMGHAGAMPGQVGMVLLPAAMLLGPIGMVAGAVARLGLGVAGLFLARSKHKQEMAAQEVKAKQELAKQLVGVATLRLEETRRTLDKQVKRVLQDVSDRLADAREEVGVQGASGASAMQRGLSGPMMDQLRDRWLPELEAFVQGA